MSISTFSSGTAQYIPILIIAPELLRLFRFNPVFIILNNILN